MDKALTRYQKIKLARAGKRAEDARRAWGRLSKFCESRAVRAKIFGSIPEGRNDEHSDLDVMIFGDISADVMREIVREAAAASTSEQVPIDLLFERDFPELSKAI